MAAETTRPLAGLHIVVTGASRGIGEAVARRCAADGADVVLAASASGGTDPAPLQAVAASINAGDGGRAVTSIGPIESFEYAGELVRTCVDAFGSIDGLMAIAGVPSARRKSIRDTDLAEWRRQLAVHLDGTFNCCRHAVPLMVAQGRGSIVTTTSDSRLGTYAGTGYPAAKGGIVSLTRAIAADLRGTGVRCNTVAPGARTPMADGPAFERAVQRQVDAGTLDPLEAQAVLAMPGPEHVAPVYAFLASDDAAGVTGQVIRARGGLLQAWPLPEPVTLAQRPVDAGVWTHDELRSLLAPGTDAQG